MGTNNMIKRSLLATAIAAMSVQATNAAPFLPMDARGLAMGNTGVASAQRAHAPAYNPSLLSQGSDDDDFALLRKNNGQKKEKKKKKKKKKKEKKKKKKKKKKK